ncbi:MAG: hypothetical protein IJG17_03795, partial [Eubacterium sp.]|nr:hypothetical protein [Eubacterium sp.]
MENEEKVIFSEVENENSKAQEPPKGEWPPKGPRPEPPKDENGNPITPPKDGRGPHGPGGPDG